MIEVLTTAREQMIVPYTKIPDTARTAAYWKVYLDSYMIYREYTPIVPTDLNWEMKCNDLSIWNNY